MCDNSMSSYKVRYRFVKYTTNVNPKKKIVSSSDPIYKPYSLSVH